MRNDGRNMILEGHSDYGEMSYKGCNKTRRNKHYILIQFIIKHEYSIFRFKNRSHF